MTDGSLTTDRPAPGTRLEFRWRKWDGSDHWVHDCVYLGSDEWGDWFGQLPGWRSHRPGRDILAKGANVSLLPPSGQWCFTRNEPPSVARVYIDVAWDLRWEDGLPTGIDMDLDVVRREPEDDFVDADGVLRHPGEVYVEDRGEWEEHRVRFGYPLDVVQTLEQVAVELESRVRAQDAPFDAITTDRWLERLALLAS